MSPDLSLLAELQARKPVSTRPSAASCNADFCCVVADTAEQSDAPAPRGLSMIWVQMNPTLMQMNLSHCQKAPSHSADLTPLLACIVTPALFA